MLWRKHSLYVTHVRKLIIYMILPRHACPPMSSCFARGLSENNRNVLAPSVLLVSKMLENRVPLKLKNNVTSFSEIFWSELNWVTYSGFVETVTARTMPGSIVMTYTYLVHTRMQALKPNKQMPALTPNKQPYLHFFSSRSLFFCWVFWCTHFAWNSTTAVYSSLCTLTAVQVYIGIFV